MNRNEFTWSFTHSLSHLITHALTLLLAYSHIQARMHARNFQIVDYARTHAHTHTCMQVHSPRLTDPSTHSPTLLLIYSPTSWVAHTSSDRPTPHSPSRFAQRGYSEVDVNSRAGARDRAGHGKRRQVRQLFSTEGRDPAGRRMG